MKRIFTYREAKNLLPSVREMTHKTYVHTEEIGRELRQSGLSGDRRAELEEEYESVVSAWAEKLMGLGVEIKGMWLVDFDNGKGYYCWKYPEPSLDHYHSYEDGFAGRMRIN